MARARRRIHRAARGALRVGGQKERRNQQNRSPDGRQHVVLILPRFNDFIVHGKMPARTGSRRFTEIKTELPAGVHRRLHRSRSLRAASGKKVLANTLSFTAYPRLSAAGVFARRP
jgi:hypothetical protein